MKDLYRYRIDPIGGYYIARERLPVCGIDQLPGYGGEIAATLRVGQHGGRVTQRNVAQISALVSAKEEKPVLLDGPTGAASELVALEEVMRRGEKVAGIQIAVT